MRHIALLTDFGTRDPYVAAMKGVLASRTDARVHDLTHDIAAFDVLEAAWFLRTIVPYWPAGTIFVCVVDPGVGTDRRIIALEEDGRVFLAPDNGLLTFVRTEQSIVRSVENESLFLPVGSTTFHGRDRFAPVAAAIANVGQALQLVPPGMGPAGEPALRDVGPRIDAIDLLPYDAPAYGDMVRGTIVAIDRFGNAITDIERAKVPFDAFSLHGAEVEIERIERTYGDAAPGAFLIVGSSGCIEISIANASAAERLHLRRLDRVELWPKRNLSDSDSRGASSRY